MASKVAITPRTQKVKGIMALKNSSACGTPAPILTVIQSEEDLKRWSYPTKGNLVGKVFARPCPVTPRHGFVDSRMVKSKEELEGVWKETMAADPNGELLLMPFMSPLYNAIWTPSLITIGRGHDGATAGKDVVTFPLSGILPLAVETLKINSGVAKDDDPYIEVVYKEDPYETALNPRLTQLRAGVKVTGKADFIPAPTEVEEILIPNGMDLLQWETLIKSKVGVEGVVVNNVGGSPCDHYSVHAITYSIPTITSRKVEKGELLDVIPFTPPTPLKVLEGILAIEGVNLSISINRSMSTSLLLMALHNAAKLEGDQGVWLGVGVGLMLKLGSMALKGEARHLNWGASKQMRDTSYQLSAKHSLHGHRIITPRSINILRYGDFGGAGVGGRKWAECGGVLCDLFDAVYLLAKNPIPDQVNHLIRVLNLAVNQAHNGGWWLNKFTSGDTFFLIQQGDVRCTLKCLPLVYEVGKMRENLTQPKVDEFIKRVGRWGKLKLKHSPIVTVELQMMPGVDQVRLKITDKLIKSNHRNITVPLKGISDVMEKINAGNLYLTTTSDGLQLEVIDLKHPTSPTVVWKEKPVKVYDELN